MSGAEPTSPTLKYAAVLNINNTIGMKWILTVTEGRCVRFARLVYTVFCVQGNYPLFGLRVRGVSAIQGFLMYSSNGSSIGT